MKHSHRRFCLCLPALAIVTAVILLPRDAVAQTEADVINGAGIVWFAGNVVSDSDEAPRIDLGDVHGILEGDRLAAFRPENNHHTPLGTIQIVESHNTWSRPGDVPGISLKKGDIILGIRTLRQIGTGRELQEAFLERQLVRSSNRNSYSTVREEQSARILRGLIRRQSRWIRELKPIAGQVRSDSFSVENFQKIQPLLNQIRRFQEFRATGVPMDRCLGKEWNSVLATLTPEAAPTTPVVAEAKPQPSTTAADPTAQPDSLKSELETRIDLVREETSQLLFDRFPEERNVAIVLGSVIDLESPRNEPLWISLELSRSQFPELADDREMLQELPEILKRVRARINP